MGERRKSDGGAESTKGRDGLRDRYIKYGGMTSEEAHRRSGEIARRVERKKREEKDR